MIAASPVLYSPDEHGADAAKQRRFGDCDHSGIDEALVDQAKDFRRAPIGWREVVRPIEVDVVDLGLVHESGDL